MTYTYINLVLMIAVHTCTYLSTYFITEFNSLDKTTEPHNINKTLT